MTIKTIKFHYWLIKLRESNFAYLMDEEPKYNKYPYYDYKVFKYETIEKYLECYCIFRFDIAEEMDCCCLETLDIYPEDDTPIEFIVTRANNRNGAFNTLYKERNKKVLI